MSIKQIDGVSFELEDDYAICYIDEFSDNLKDCLRQHLTAICHGENFASMGMPSHTYNATLKNFRNRYKSKTSKMQKGMMGELLSHVLISELIDDFDIVTPFFNMEEKSQRKGFDLILYSQSQKNVWITEVKSGELGKSNTPNSAISKFLGVARADLNQRLNEGENTFWLNAVNAAYLTISESKDYKSAVIQILSSEGGLAVNDAADSTDNNVVLISTLFSDISKKFEKKIPKEFAEDLAGRGIFNRLIVFSIQKSTYKKIADFIFAEEANA